MTVLKFLNVPAARIKAINNVPLAVIWRVNNVTMSPPVLIGNDATGATFYRTDCVSTYGANYEPVGVYFNVPANTFTAATKAEANQLAYAYLISQGPIYAASNDTCVYVPPEPVVYLNGFGWGETNGFITQVTMQSVGAEISDFVGLTIKWGPTQDGLVYSGIPTQISNSFVGLNMYGHQPPVGTYFEGYGYRFGIYYTTGVIQLQ